VQRCAPRPRRSRTQRACVENLSYSAAGDGSGASTGSGGICICGICGSAGSAGAWQNAACAAPSECITRSEASLMLCA
jgi:hypothetical protein